LTLRSDYRLSTVYFHLLVSASKVAATLVQAKTTTYFSYNHLSITMKKFILMCSVLVGSCNFDFLFMQALSGEYPWSYFQLLLVRD